MCSEGDSTPCCGEDTHQEGTEQHGSLLLHHEALCPSPQPPCEGLLKGTFEVLYGKLRISLTCLLYWVHNLEQVEQGRGQPHLDQA